MMKMEFKFLTLLILNVPTLVSAANSCACLAQDLSFTINCDDTATMLTALNDLKTSACATACTSDECVKNYYIMQSHHDYCPEAGIPQEIEDGFHDFDDSCTPCKIQRKPTEGAPPCPTPNCEDNSGNDAYTKLVDSGCGTDCSSDICRDAFFTVRAAHDTCPHDTLSRAAEEGLHDLEIPCANQICNPGEEDQITCKEEDEHELEDHGEEETTSEETPASGAFRPVTAGAGLMGFIMMWA
ncbi:expressed unknown protein [Seminavis robusta]|uniref:Uncharacterized protein n=1 Tax=Seminavis robusta TaxID=568900 RepID=A0A9N8DZZ2_9STRA|nr:expressed unknown protein [Seminavis robusta]|eukprot:Sro400_g135200.1 n/a (241) ;mRNA; r:58157-58879